MNHPARNLAIALWLVAASAAGQTERPVPLAAPQPDLEPGTVARAEDLIGRIDSAEQEGRYADGIDSLQELLALWTRNPGADHWQTVDIRWRLGLFRALNDAAPVDRNEWRESVRAANEAQELLAAGRAAEAENRLQRYVDQCEKVLGRDNSYTAVGYNDLGIALNVLRKTAEAEQAFQRALDIRLRLLGPRHPQTAASYSSLAVELASQGRNHDALPLYQKALETRAAALGDKHPKTYEDRNNLAVSLQALGQHAMAQPLYQEVLEHALERFGGFSPQAALALNNLAANLASQGKYAEAGPFFQQALELRVELLGEEDSDSIASLISLADNLKQRERYAEARPLLERALSLSLAHHGGDNPVTASAHGGLGGLLYAQGDYAAAGAHFQKAHEINLALVTERHPLSITSLNNLAANLDAQHHHAAAQPLLERALAAARDVLGEDHPTTVVCLNNLAVNLLAQGKLDEARRAARAGANAYEASRIGVAPRGFDRAIYGAERSVYRLLAAIAARGAAPLDAWLACEADLARGLGELSAGAGDSAEDSARMAREQQVATRLARIQPRLAQLASAQRLSAARGEELDALRREDRELRQARLELAAARSRRALATLEEIQAALPPRSGLVTWVDLGKSVIQEHWVCLLRPAGEPVWRSLAGTGPRGEWTADDSALPGRFREAVFSRTTTAEEIDALARRLFAQRLEPVIEQLDGMETLYVAAVRDMAGLPLELLVPRLTVSYVPSGTFLARLAARPPAARSGLLVLADPVFQRERPGSAPTALAELPPGGLLITQVEPDGQADRAQLRPGDVLVRYAGAELDSVEALSAAIAEQARAGAKNADIDVWRPGNARPITRNVAVGRLGLGLLRKPARQALAWGRKSLALVESLRTSAWRELPGTRVELAQLQRLFGGQATALADFDASEQALDGLRRGGRLEGFRYLHLATHGEANDQQAFESRLVLAQGAPPPDTIPKFNDAHGDGYLTAGEVLRTWNLRADLVTLSACETALGRKAGGEGLLGFSQAFLAAGSRSVVLSLWKVDDAATALLMTRFYQNLLGKRGELERPLTKSHALAEAKEWLRNLEEDQARVLLENAWQSVARGDRGKNEILNLAPPVAPAPAQARRSPPFAHPRFWAAFVLIGDPG